MLITRMTVSENYYFYWIKIYFAKQNFSHNYFKNLDNDRNYTLLNKNFYLILLIEKRIIIFWIYFNKICNFNTYELYFFLMNLYLNKKNPIENK
jgi:hypothetical protein